MAILVVGLFDGIGALRMAVELLGVPVLGYISVEPHKPAQRVVESHFPGVVHVDKVQDVTPDMVKAWGAAFSQAALVLLGAGPPCQGVSGLNTDRRGALKDEWSSLFTEVSRIRKLLDDTFVWCPTYSLMESVASMDASDRHIMSRGFGCDPVLCDAGGYTWCNRPRLYWCSWELRESAGMRFIEHHSGVRQLLLEGHQDISHVTRQGGSR